MQPAVPADSDNVREGPEAVTLHVLCPFGTPPNRFTFDNVPLFTTIAQLRVQLARTILGSTVPTTSRLIFLGRPLTVDSATLGEVLVPSNGSEYTVHFVPQPSAPTRPCVQASSAANPQAIGEPNSAIETRAMQLSRNITYDALLGQIQAARRVAWGTSSTSLMETPRPNPVTAEDIARLEVELANFQERANHELRARLESQQVPLRQRPRVHDGQSAGQPLPTASTKRLNGTSHPLHYDRHDQTGNTHTRIFAGDQTQSPNTPSPVYQTFGPDGYVAIALPGAVSGHQQSHNGPNINLSFGANTAPADRAVAENIVRQALINNQQRRRDENANALGIGRILSRVWLFIRLYFFCYMVSAPDTWTRIFFVTAAALICLLSDTDIPQILHGLIVQPLQRHLEGLAHMGGPGQPIRDGPRNGLSGEISDYFRRAERSIALLIASLIPGIGERQVEARNAAEAEAERARQEARDREQQQEQEQRAQAQAQQAQTQATQDNENVEEPQQAAAPVSTDS